jgi:hypothetical protein
MEGQDNLSDSDRNQAAPAGSVARDTKGKGLSGKARRRILNTMLFSSIARFATFQVTMLIMTLCIWNHLLYHYFLLFLLLSTFDV